ncbi:TPA: hypothetical protein ACH3X1_014303 [Trebouxia sp. C0004]
MWVADVGMAIHSSNAAAAAIVCDQRASVAGAFDLIALYLGVIANLRPASVRTVASCQAQPEAEPHQEHDAGV